MTVKRILSVAVLGVLSSLAGVSGAMAESARIKGFHEFTCHSADGDLLEPKYMTIAGVYFDNLPADREDCYAAVDRGIALCEENTRFEAEHDNLKYPGCLPIFERQAKVCATFFRDQRTKCDAGGDGTTDADGDGASDAGGDGTTAGTVETAECAAALKRYEELAAEYLAALKKLERNYSDENIKVANDLARDAQVIADTLSDCN